MFLTIITASKDSSYVNNNLTYEYYHKVLYSLFTQSKNRIENA